MAVLDQRSNASCAKFLAETHMVVALVGAKGPQVALRNAGDLRAEIRLVGPLRTTTNVDNRTLRGVDEKRGFDSLCLTVTPLERGVSASDKRECHATRCSSGVSTNRTGLAQLRLKIDGKFLGGVAG